MGNRLIKYKTQEEKRIKKRKKIHFNFSIFIIIIVIIIFSLLGGMVSSYFILNNSSALNAKRINLNNIKKIYHSQLNKREITVNVEVPLPKVSDVPSETNSSSDIVDKVSKSVVGIVAVRENGEESLGTGFVIDGKGHIITNYHVVQNTIEVNLIFPTGEKTQLETVNVNQNVDIALLKIKDQSYNTIPPAAMGNSDDAKVGEKVYAIGTPVSTELIGTVTSGIISAVNRTINSSSFGYLQTDAAINGGNSGGPLINEQGEIIGVNTMKISLTSVEGVSFSIPINEVKKILNELMS